MSSPPPTAARSTTSSNESFTSHQDEFAVRKAATRHVLHEISVTGRARTVTPVHPRLNPNAGLPADPCQIRQNKADRAELKEFWINKGVLTK